LQIFSEHYFNTYHIVL